MNRLAYILLFLTFSCVGPEKTSGGDSVPRGYEYMYIKVVTEKHEEPIPDVIVKVRVKDNAFDCITDANGSCKIIAKTNLLNSNYESVYTIQNSELRIDKTWNFPISRNVILAFDLLKGKPKQLEAKASQRNTDLSDIGNQIDGIDSYINNLKEDINRYIEKYGPSAVEAYLVEISNQEDILLNLRSTLANLKRDYEYTLSILDEETIIDLTGTEDEFFKLKTKVRRFKESAAKSASSIDNNLIEESNSTIEYFFETGEFTNPINFEDIDDGVVAFVQNMNNYKLKHFPYVNVENLNIIIYSVGYTDGQKVDRTGSKAQAIINNCESTEYARINDLNYCLGYLRAFTLAGILNSHLNFPADIQVKSEGSKLATNEKDIKELRKCVISFAMYEKQ